MACHTKERLGAAGVSTRARVTREPRSLLGETLPPREKTKRRRPGDRFQGASLLPRHGSSRKLRNSSFSREGLLVPSAKQIKETWAKAGSGPHRSGNGSRPSFPAPQRGRPRGDAGGGAGPRGVGAPGAVRGKVGQRARGGRGAGQRPARLAAEPRSGQTRDFADPLVQDCLPHLDHLIPNRAHGVICGSWPCGSFRTTMHVPLL